MLMKAWVITPILILSNSKRNTKRRGLTQEAGCPNHRHWKQPGSETQPLLYELIYHLGWLWRAETCPPKCTCWSPKPSKPQHVTVFGNGVLKEVIKVKWGHMDGPSSNMTALLLRRGHLDKHKLHEGWAHTEEGSCEEAARGQPSASQGERLREKQPCWPLDLGLSASRGIRKKFLLFKVPSLWCFITAN